MNIERATIADAEEILALQKEAFTQEAERYNNFAIRPLTETVEQFTSLFEINSFLVVRETGGIVGSVTVREENGTAFIGRLIVKRDFQNRGIGSFLLDSVEKQFVHLNRFELFTGHLSDRNRAIYQHKGYREFRRGIMDGIEMVFMEKVNSI